METFSEADEDRQRWVSEAPKSAQRSDFERDRARVLHSAGFRRLGAKTQVMGPGSDDSIRTRLTHSLEVAQVGREIGKALGADADVVDTACLSHDLGHPPFGHNGERALNEIAAPCGGFEGNAQTFRLVTRLEPKVVAADGSPAGLNLTRASLDAVCKYPWLPGQGPDPVKSAVKYCVYPEDVAAFEWMRVVPDGRRCLEAQIMDLSDDIAYSVHDIEDAVMTRRFDPTWLREDDQFAAVLASTRQWYGCEDDDAAMERARQQLVDHRFWMGSFDGSYRARAQLKDMTSQLIGEFCSAAVEATRASAGQRPLKRYDTDLIVPAQTLTQITLLKGIAVHYVMAPRETEPTYLEQRTVLMDLVDFLMESGPDQMEEPFASAVRAADTEQEKLRAVIDQVASLTDVSAVQWHGRLCGLLSRVYG
ncbi:MAG: deoxyguanosinetriphosphate triphosphohydrolase [Actinomycetaceae bacterium]|nr:deoxyguanosinetriphosphate triphosphohydrolase [Actinomycetaceae bacterium]